MLFSTTQRTLQNVRDVPIFHGREGRIVFLSLRLYYPKSGYGAAGEGANPVGNVGTGVGAGAGVGGGVMLDGGGVGVGAGVGRCVFFATKVRRRRRRRGTVG